MVQGAVVLFALVLGSWLLWTIVRWLWKKDSVISPLPVLGAALAFRTDPLGFLQSLAASRDVVTIDLAGLHLTLLLDDASFSEFYRSRTLNSYAALQRLGFEDTLGHLNLHLAVPWHRMLLRGGAFTESQFLPVLDRHISQRIQGLAGRVDVYLLCREIVVASMIEFFVGPDTHFDAQYLDFQRTHEAAVAAAMAMGRVLAWPFLWNARRKRLALVDMLVAQNAVTSLYSEALAASAGQHSTVLSKVDQADALIGLLSAATKNVAIGSASCLVYLLEHPEQTPAVGAAVVETLRLTALSIGALREITVDDSPYGKRGDLCAVSHAVQARRLCRDDRPDQFDAMRWPQDVTGIDASVARLPVFGAGLHACPGRKLALASMRHLVSRLRPLIKSLEDRSPLQFDRPSLADRDYAFVEF